MIIAAFVLVALGVGTYAWVNRATVVHEELHLVGELEKTKTCTTAGHCYASGYVNGEHKYYHGYHPNCSGTKRVRGIEHQRKRIWSDDDITYDYPFTAIEDVTDCSL